MRVREASVNDIYRVVKGMRAGDAAEQFLCRWNDDPLALADELVQARPAAIAHLALCADDDEAVALLGAWEISPRVASMHQVATDRWPAIGRQAHRYYRRTFIPDVLGPAVRLAECRLVPKSVRWVTALGFRAVTPPLPWGRGGEDLVHCVWLNPRELP